VSSSPVVIAFVFVVSFLLAGSAAYAKGDPLIDEATGTKFDETAVEEGQRFECLGAGIRKLMIANVYSVAFCVDAQHADQLVQGYVGQHHAGLQGDALFKALRQDQKLFDMLATTKHDRLAVLKMQRNVSQKQLASTIRRSLTPLLPKAKLDKLTSAIAADAKKGQVVKIYALGAKLTVDVAGASRTFEDEEVTRKVFLVWLGSKSVSPTLREDIARRAARLP
jgi:hypothetical protein